MTKKAWFGDVMPSRKSKPTTDNTPSTPGTTLMTSSTCRTTSPVRLMLAPSGKRSAANSAPWSSSGRKLCGVRLNRQPEAAITAIDSDDADKARRAPDA